MRLQGQVLPAGAVLIHAGGLGHITNLPPDPGRVIQYVVPGNDRLPAIGLGQGGQDADYGAFAGPVGT